mgnify:CR=1 FL=1
MTLYIFVEIKKEIFEKEKRVHSIDTFCNIYKRNNLDKAIPSTKTVYKMIHRGQIEGIQKPFFFCIFLSHMYYLTTFFQDNENK